MIIICKCEPFVFIRTSILARKEFLVNRNLVRGFSGRPKFLPSAAAAVLFPDSAGAFPVVEIIVSKRFSLQTETVCIYNEKRKPICRPGRYVFHDCGRGKVIMIQAKKLYFSYTGSPPYVLNGIDLEIHAGEYVSVVGENGCGKSTLMRLILRFLKPTSGEIATRAKRIGYVPQKSDFSNSGFPITVYEMLNSYRRLLKLKDKGIPRKSLERVGMSAFSDSLMGNLSGGQTQKILVARALIGNPDLLILDEPSTGVDVGSQKEIYGFLKEINRKGRITIVSVEHNLEAAVANSTLIYHLVDGKGHTCSPRQYADEYLRENRIGG